MNRARTDYRFLFFSLIAMSLAGPLLGPAFADRGILEVTFAAVLIAAVSRSTRGPLQVTLSLVLGSLALLSLLAGRFTETGFLPMAQSALLACFLCYIAFLVLSDILGTQGVTSHEVYGALSVYLLVGATWEFFYALCLQADPGAIAFPEGSHLLANGPAESGTTMQDLTYFSFVTLTTLGYGDILPISRLARTLAWMEAVFGQLFLAVLVARLVGLMRNGRRDRHRGSGSEKS